MLFASVGDRVRVRVTPRLGHVSAIQALGHAGAGVVQPPPDADAPAPPS